MEAEYIKKLLLSLAILIATPHISAMNVVSHKWNEYKENQQYKKKLQTVAKFFDYLHYDTEKNAQLFFEDNQASIVPYINTLVDKHENSLLHIAVVKRKTAIATLLINNGALVNQRNYQNVTPLTNTIILENILLAKRLINAGAEIDLALLPNGRKAIDRVNTKTKDAIYQELKKYNAKKNKIVSTYISRDPASIVLKYLE